MSGLLKGIKKVFKKVAKFVKKYWKVIVIAAAVYFTAGVALSYFGSTAGFASAMPGFGTGGMLSKAAVWMGFKGSATVASGLSMTAGGAWAGAMVPAGTTLASYSSTMAPVGVTGTKVAAGSTIASTNAAAAAAAKQAAMTAGFVGGAPGAFTGAAGTTTAADAAIKAMTTAYKLQAASTLISTAGGLLAPSEDSINKKQHARQYANAFGVDRAGNTQYGWQSSGGNDAFKDMYIPGAAKTPQDQASPYAKAVGEDFPTGEPSANHFTSMDGGQGNFLQTPMGTPA